MTTVTHKFLGAVCITDACLALQAQNTDPSTLYVEHDGEIREVTKALIAEDKTALYTVTVRINEDILRAWQYPNNHEGTMLSLVQRAIHTYNSDAIEVLAVEPDLRHLCRDYSPEAIRGHFEDDDDPEIQHRLKQVSDAALEAAAMELAIENDVVYRDFHRLCLQILQAAAEETAT